MPRLPPGPAAIRAHMFTQWMVAGALAGIILSLTQAQNPWAGAGITSNIIQAIGAGIASGLLARGACWIWLARQK
jgi:stage V sporulation protein SpoVS